jgi:hypothetical protein
MSTRSKTPPSDVEGEDLVLDVEEQGTYPHNGDINALKGRC